MLPPSMQHLETRIGAGTPEGWSKVPKIVDHEGYREELAARAVRVFRERGYHGLSMRAVAGDLGVSKGMLYHYFTGKQDLFEACSRHATRLDLPVLPECPSAAERQDALTALARSMEADLAGELRLLLDYIRGRSTDEIASDGELRAALGRYADAVAAVAGADRVDVLLPHLFGVLLLRLFDGGRTPLERVGDVLG